MTTYACPKGHDSSTDDFCDTCGTKIGGTNTGGPGIGAPAAAGAAAPPAAVAACPHCGAPRAGSGRFCEDCGFDHQTGKVPVLAPPAPRTATWTATVAADRDYFDANGIEGVEFPSTPASRTVTVQPPQIRIGRRSASQGITPEIDLRDDDPGVSHNHALLTLSVDGVWLLSDLGSTNGTYLNDEQKPLTAGQSRSVAEDDRIHVGAWTTITLHRSDSI